MPRRITPFVPGSYYHIYHRGNNRQTIFFQPENYDYLFDRLQIYLSPVFDLLVYCLMPTHYHLFGQVRERVVHGHEISNAMMRVQVSYTHAVNRRFARVGTLFQGPFRAKLAADEEYVRHLCRYIHANPVRAGLVVDPLDWPHSNFPGWARGRFDTKAEKAFFGSVFGSPGGYIQFVSEYIENGEVYRESSELYNSELL